MLLELAKEYGIKVVCTNNVHFVEKEQAEAHDRLLCIATKKKLENRKRIRYTKQEWLKTYKEMIANFKDIPEALSNTIEILNKVELYSIDHDQILPLFPIPKEYKSEYEYLKELTIFGAHQIYGKQLPSEVKERLQFEFSVIKTKGSAMYLLIIQDLINAMRNDYGVIVGPGRGSVAGSLVCYCLGISKIDPLKYDLLFERFDNFNYNRLPDIDIDFDKEGRYFAEKYLEDKYGKENCAHIVTFDKMDPKKAMMKVAKLDKIPNSVSNALNKKIPKSLPGWVKKEMKFICNYIPAIQKAAVSKNPAIRKLITNTKNLDNTICGMGIHACGLIVSQGPISNWVPVCTLVNPDNGERISCTQYSGWYVELTGLIKFDLLELNTLTEIKETLLKIKQSHGIDVNIDQIPIDDQKTFELFQQGNTIGVFEFDLNSLRKYLRELKPAVFEDLVALFILVLPGTDRYLPSYIAKKKGQKKIKYDIPCMERYLKDTCGITIYQEQLMNLSRLLANFTREESDILRKAMGKKKQELIDSLKPKFIEGGIKNGHDPKILEKVCADWEKYGAFAYCKSHAVCYTWLAFQTAYLKAHYPVEYMSTLLNCRKNDKSEISKLKKECERMGIQPI